MAVGWSVVMALALLSPAEGGVPRVRARAAPRMSTASKPVATSAEQASVPWDRDGWVAGYRTAPSEDSYSVRCDELPADLVGTFFRNVPAKFEVGEQRIKHPFDADGMLVALTFDGAGQVHFRNRFVRTKGYVRETQAGKMLYPGQFSNPRPIWAGGLEVRAARRASRLAALPPARAAATMLLAARPLLTRLAAGGGAQPKNVANTNVLWWGGRLLALWEGGRPHLMDSLSLATSRESDLAGLLKPGDTFSAHPRRDVANNRLVNFAYMPNPLSGKTQLTFYEFGPDFRPINKERPRLLASVPGFCLVHDFALTANYYVVTQAPTSFGANPLDTLLGKKSLGAPRRAPTSRRRASPAAR